MKQKIYDSVVFKLILAVVVIFIIMLLASMYLINRKQAMVIDAVIEDINENMSSMDRSMVLFVDSSKLQSLSDFTVYLILVMSTVIILGSLSFAFIIKKILAPLKKFQKKLGEVDIDRPESFENLVILDNTSSEIVELSQTFDKMLKKIYADYKRQKDFSSNVAHELRTPIAVMKSQLDVFRQKTDDEDARKMLRVLDSNVSKLNGLVDAILSLRKKSKLKFVDVNLDILVDEIILDLEDKAEENGIDLIVKDTNISLVTDDGLLQRLVFNIVENAIKYNNPGGKVEISAKQVKDMVQIIVADTGVGISQADKERIFELFYQIDSSRGQEGFGIGLSLSKTIANMLGATIEITDNEPKGSIFTVKIPKSL
ncbi:sensor histidine kinase [Anaerococcus lactolyticus]|uniref:histidine kinase n=2 Tax=Anaerococcus lactolyticus TaxID=33032 RepID=C2BFF9_9FIRM|nr:HAMP domain-containing sensor histidine kinase [Anaerococcus lactolyticus]EEI86363.1 ATPase/histidine kinase/DNA gyrase B/HSP90 domain protein [Anaerococcus lactolyticus ATCC 51172]KGF05804.1 histidine kinase [Anaerococcus lactolyticus S7-1-13]